MSEKQPKKKKTAGDVVLTVVLIAAICVFCYAGYNLFHIYTEYKKGTDEYNSITQMAVTERDPDGEAAGPEAGSELKAPMDIDFASLKSVNDDVVGWIYVEAVPDINYPIVHGKDNETYLHRTYEKNYNFAGTIFVDYENKGDFSDCNTIVYGHNMKNGSMFAQLKKFTQDEETYKKSKYFWIFTPEKNYRYEIISAYTTGVNSDTYTLFKGPGEEFEKYLEKIRGYSEIRTDAEAFHGVPQADNLPVRILPLFLSVPPGSDLQLQNVPQKLRLQPSSPSAPDSPGSDFRTGSTGYHNPPHTLYITDKILQNLWLFPLSEEIPPPVPH